MYVLDNGFILLLRRSIYLMIGSFFFPLIFAFLSISHFCRGEEFLQFIFPRDNAHTFNQGNWETERDSKGDTTNLQRVTRHFTGPTPCLSKVSCINIYIWVALWQWNKIKVVLSSDWRLHFDVYQHTRGWKRSKVRRPEESDAVLEVQRKTFSSSLFLFFFLFQAEIRLLQNVSHLFYSLEGIYPHQKTLQPLYIISSPPPLRGPCATLKALLFLHSFPLKSESNVIPLKQKQIRIF